MDGPGDYHTNWSKSERQLSYDITYMCNLKYDTGKPVYRNRNRPLDIEKRLVAAKGQGAEGGTDREFGISRCKLVYTEPIKSKVLLYSMGNCIQYHVINHNRKDRMLLGHLSCVWIFATPWTVAHQVPLSLGFCRQEYWSGLPCPPPGDLPDPGTEPRSLMSPALSGRFFTTSTTWEAQ